MAEGHEKQAINIASIRRADESKERDRMEPESNNEASGPFLGWVLCLPKRYLGQVQGSLFVQNQTWAWF